jgi:hypothetical protein
MFEVLPLNWFSDDVTFKDLNRKSLVHYFSRACVHHAGIRISLVLRGTT